MQHVQSGHWVRGIRFGETKLNQLKNVDFTREDPLAVTSHDAARSLIKEVKEVKAGV